MLFACLNLVYTFQAAAGQLKREQITVYEMICQAGNEKREKKSYHYYQQRNANYVVRCFSGSLSKTMERNIYKDRWPEN